MKVLIERENKLLELEGNCTGQKLLSKLNISASTVLIAKNDEIVLPEELLKEEDEVKILSVVSGG